MEENNILQGLLDSLYTGDIPITKENFPQKPSPQWLIDEGKAIPGDISSIITMLDSITTDQGGGWLLRPGMIKGLTAHDQIDSLIKAEGYKTLLGIYKTKDEANLVDSLIHESLFRQYDEE